MKIRIGFVSNSSSTSFTCDVCGTTESGMDASPGDLDMFECENGHTFCKSHVKDIQSANQGIETIEDLQNIAKRFHDTSFFLKDKIKNVTSETFEEVRDTFINDLNSYYVLAEACPLCKMEVVCDHDMIHYIYKITDKTEAEYKKEIRKRFKSYNDLKDFLYVKEKS